MTTDMPTNSPTLYVLIGSVKSDLFKADFDIGRKTNELPNPHTFNVLHQKAQTVSNCFKLLLVHCDTYHGT